MQKILDALDTNQNDLCEKSYTYKYMFVQADT